MIVSWQKRRSELNHDWLKNRYLLALGAWMNLLNGNLEDYELEISFVDSVLPEWETHCEQAIQLARDFEEEMSPRRLFDGPLLVGCSPGTKEWLGPLVHALWLQRCPVDRWVTEAIVCAKDCDMAYHRLEKKLRECSDAKSVRALRGLQDLFGEFRRCCQGLTVAISQFPSQVSVV